MKLSQQIVGQFRSPLIIAIALFFTGCVAPLNTSFESARMLKQGEMEFMGSYARYSTGEGSELEHSNSNISARAGIGVTDKFNIKMRYARLMPPMSESDAVNYLALEPKFTILQDHIAAVAPFGAYFAGGDSEFFVSPKFLFTYPSANNKLDVTFGTKTDIFFNDWDVYLGLNLGAGFSSDLSRWAIRPEVGYLVDLGTSDPGERAYAWNWGVGFVYTISDVW